MAVINYKAVRRSLKSLRSQVGSAMVGFIQSGTGAVVSDVQRKLRETVSVLDFIPVAEHAAIKAGTSTYDCTADIVRAFAAHNVVDFGHPGWLFNISGFDLTDDKCIITHGAGPTFQQIAGGSSVERMIRVTGSRVRIGNCKGIGNIATDTDEQKHFIFIRGSSDIRDITIGDIIGKDIRGDVVYVGGLATAGVYDVKMGRIYIDNVLRNGVSVTGGVNVWCDAAISLGACGYSVFDIEPNANSQDCDNVHCEYAYGFHALVAGLPTVPVKACTWGFVDLDPAFQTNTTPAYSGYTGNQQGAFIVRNFESTKVRHLRTRNCDRCGIWGPSNSGDYTGSLLQIDFLEQENCSISDPTYNTYNLISSTYTRQVTVNGGNINLPSAAKHAFQGCKVTLRDVYTNGRLTLDCPKPRLERVTVESTYDVYVAGGTGATYAPLFDQCTITFTGAVGRLTNTEGGTVINSDITVGNFLVPSGTNLFCINSTLNGSFYSFGQYLRDYTAALRFGGFYVWPDSTGDFRIESGAPTSDTDGTVVGTQS